MLIIVHAMGKLRIRGLHLSEFDLNVIHHADMKNHADDALVRINSTMVDTKPPVVVVLVVANAMVDRRNAQNDQVDNKKPLWTQSRRAVEFMVRVHAASLKYATAVKCVTQQSSPKVQAVL